MSHTFIKERLVLYKKLISRTSISSSRPAGARRSAGLLHARGSHSVSFQKPDSRFLVINKMQRGVRHLKQIPLRPFLCLRKGRGREGPQELNQPRSRSRVQGRVALSPASPPARGPGHRRLPAGRGRGRCGLGEGRRRFQTGTTSHAGPTPARGPRQRESAGAPGRKECAGKSARGRGGIRLQPPAGPGLSPGPCRPSRRTQRRRELAHSRPGVRDALGALQGEVTTRPRRGGTAGLAALPATSHSRKWGSRHILYRSEPGRTGGSLPNPAPHATKADPTPASRGPRAWQGHGCPRG